MTKRAVTAALFVAVLAGCNSDDDASVSTTFDPASPPADTITTPSTSSPTTSAPSGSSAASSPPSTTTTSTSTTSSTTTTLPPPPPTTAPPATTTAPIPFSPDDIAAAEEADRQRAIAVERDWKEATTRLIQAIITPNDRLALERALEYTAGGWTGFTQQYIESYRARGERLLPEPLREPTLTVETPPKPVAFTSDEITIVTCEIDPWVRVAADGTVVSDRISAYRVRVQMRYVDGIWKVVSKVTVEEWLGGDQCVGTAVD